VINEPDSNKWAEHVGRDVPEQLLPGTDLALGWNAESLAAAAARRDDAGRVVFFMTYALANDAFNAMLEHNIQLSSSSRCSWRPRG
jgi:hypothetical protein